ncbi:unnamed protein product [Phyllotreta striolata]|uniref:AAA+ ATPase domain-containing protein n=1 Tax=Phyllotreta striolata TaxID=444603 RepID=A0A9N9TN34_PHYSR|nr:unnamed protein product [Phyllotreta striolata]
MMASNVDVEIILQQFSPNVTASSLKEAARKYLDQMVVRPNSVINIDNETISALSHVKMIIVGEIPNYNKSFVDFNELHVNWFIYRFDTDGPLQQNEDVGDQEVIMFTQLTLPSLCLINLWENLYYDNNIKQNLLKYAQTIMEFSDKGVDPSIISCNRVILLHGPPGTGKTSLSKALAQKLTIRMSGRYSSGILIEINSHSLFSRWFSESGKLVNTMFNKINEFVENKSILVCVLIDEVESLAHARTKCLSGSEPSDSIRVVNALLTQLDQIRRHSNVLIFATSNMTESIDLAFIDRADIKQYLGNPSLQAIYKVYHSCINELIKAKIIKDQILEPIEHIISDNDKAHSMETEQLLELCKRSLGLSGRALRKIPFLAHALFTDGSDISLSKFLMAMDKAVDKEFTERSYFNHANDVKIR